MYAVKSVAGAMGLGLIGFYLGLGIVAILRWMFGYPDPWGGEINIIGGWVLGVFLWLMGIGMWGMWGREWFGLKTYQRNLPGWQRYFTFNTDHKVIGIQYLVTFMVVFFLAGALAMLMRAELAQSGNQFLSNSQYNGTMGLHGILMVAVAVAAVIGGIGNYAVPLMIGAQDMAFPRLNALTFWLVPPVAVGLLATPFLGGIEHGWTAYPPLAVFTNSSQVLFSLSIITFGLTSILGALNFIVTIIYMRAPGLTWGRLPIFVWSMFATSWIALLYTQGFAAALLLILLDRLGFNLVGYGCTTCIGNSGPLDPHISDAIRQNDLVAVAVLSGNRNFEGRVNPDTRANYLASPPLVVAYALAGRMDIDFATEPIAVGSDGKPVYLADIWPSQAEVEAAIRSSVRSEMFRRKYADVFKGDERWRNLPTPSGDLFAWDPRSTYIKKAPYFDNLSMTPPPLTDIEGARVLVMVGDSVTTDHISPAGNISPNSPAGAWLREMGVAREDFNQYGARRGHDEVMVRGTFANIRLRNLLAPGTEGGVTRHLPDGEEMTIFDASVKYRQEGVPLLVIAGKEYGTGSSRDWAAKGVKLLGVRAVIAESYERIHRSNLVGMGVLPLQFLPGENRESLGLTGTEVFTIRGIAEGLAPRAILEVTARRDDGSTVTFKTLCRIDTPVELDYYRHDGILPYVLRQIAAQPGA
ncbi:MAG: cbb3-type cytochrome c oxidase subunit I [Tepidiforma sp.]